MKLFNLKNYLLLLSFTLLLFGAGCQKKDTVGNAGMLTGADSKVWKTEKETTASGEKDKVTKEEKQQEIQFFANGSFSMRSPTQNASGKWTYDAMAKNLSLQFVGSDLTENFQVLNLTDDELKLQAADGSQMILETE
ncbi:lipocalin family protein [Adhaeribacter radiodurans]|uniref:Lipocalin family protein n=1 Tax=Adhaeribacter radiodurans TaxID=2745197 RepID=A0A7L7L6P6_9BACT|nr:lipocalin family protein [Adhaeribacter radiodurans]QMU28480.1 lipocalin family protein [Adhaeribacter radiodurans]